MYEDPKNLRLLIDNKEHPLRPHQRDALLQFRAGKETKSISLDNAGTAWYHPVQTPTMKKAGTKPPLLEIVAQGTVVIPMPKCAATSYFLQVSISQSCTSARIHVLPLGHLFSIVPGGVG